MSPDIEFDYDSSITPPAPVMLAEWRSPTNPNAPDPKLLLALIDSGAFCSVIPNSLIDNLHLRQIDEVKAGGYDDKEEDFKMKPVYSVHLTIPPLQPILARVIPKFSEDYAIVGRDIINEWLLTLDGPNRYCSV